MGKALIIGANGYLGRNIVKYLESKCESIVCCDIQETSIIPNTEYYQVDITQYSSLNKIDFSVDYVYLFAGLTGTLNGFDDYSRYIDINEKGLLNVLTKIKNSNSVARVVFPSTRLVYKGKKNVLINENDEKEPKTIYAINKLNCEMLLEVYRNTFNVNYTVFRICVPYGSIIQGDFSYGTIGMFLEKAMNGENLILFGDGSLRRTFTHVLDICESIYLTVKQEKSNGEIYNIGGENLTLFDVAKYIAEKFEVNVLFEKWPENLLKIETGDTIFDSRSLDSLIQMKYQKKFFESLI